MLLALGAGGICSCALPAARATSEPSIYCGERLIVEPIVLSGTDRLVITDESVILKNDIILRDSAVLEIHNASLEHVVDYSGQFSLTAFDRSRVVIVDSTIESSPWINWHFFDDTALEMTRVANQQSQIWHGFTGRAHATVTAVTRFYGTVNRGSAVVADGVSETFVETVFPADADVDEAYPGQIGASPYAFPNDGERGDFPSLNLRNVGAARWGITYVPGDDVSIRDTRSLVVTFHLDSSMDQMTATFEDLRVQRYADRTWTTGGATLRLVNTTTLPWSPIVSGNNRLVITNSELADNAFSFGNGVVVVSDSSLSYVRGNDAVRIDIVRSSVAGDVVAGGDSLITLTDSLVGGRIVEEDRGRVVRD